MRRRTLMAAAATTMAVTFLSGCNDSDNAADNAPANALGVAVPAPLVGEESPLKGPVTLITGDGSFTVASYKVEPSMTRPAMKAPSGASLIRFSLDPTETWSVKDAKPTIEVRAGGKTYPVTAMPTQEAVTYAMAVPGDGKDAAVEVSVDGVRQSVSLSTGERTVDAPAKPYYDRWGEQSLRSDVVPTSITTPKLTHPMTASVSLIRAPWIPGHGWAKEGQVWVEAFISMKRPAGTGPQATVEKATLNGIPTDLTIKVDGGSPTFLTGVFTIPATEDPLNLSITGTVTSMGETSPYTVTFSKSPSP